MGGRFRIGDWTVQLSGRAGALEAIERAWARFSAETPADVEAEAKVVLEVEPGVAPARSPSMPDLSAGPGGSIQLASASFQAEIDARRRSARVRGADERFGVETIVKCLLAARLAKAGGLLVHGVALSHGGRAALFTGPSGAGKSTLGRFGVEGGLALLSDELVAVQPEEGGGFRAEGTPWNAGAPGRAALAMVGTLGWASPPRLEPQPPAEVMRVLMGNVLVPEPGPAGRSAAFQGAARLVNGVRTGRLWFAQDAGVGAVLRAELG